MGACMSIGGGGTIIEQTDGGEEEFHNLRFKKVMCELVQVLLIPTALKLTLFFYTDFIMGLLGLAWPLLFISPPIVDASAKPSSDEKDAVIRIDSCV